MEVEWLICDQEKLLALFIEHGDEFQRVLRLKHQTVVLNASENQGRTVYRLNSCHRCQTQWFAVGIENKLSGYLNEATSAFNEVIFNFRDVSTFDLTTCYRMANKQLMLIKVNTNKLAGDSHHGLLG